MYCKQQDNKKKVRPYWSDIRHDDARARIRGHGSVDGLTHIARLSCFGRGRRAGRGGRRGLVKVSEDRYGFFLTRYTHGFLGRRCAGRCCCARRCANGTRRRVSQCNVPKQPLVGVATLVRGIPRAALIAFAHAFGFAGGVIGAPAILALKNGKGIAVEALLVAQSVGLIDAGD